jgi:hypothetical protein
MSDYLKQLISDRVWPGATGQSPTQGCQMVYFKPKKSQFEGLGLEKMDIFYGLRE